MAQSPAQWNMSVASLKRFIQREGHCRVPHEERDSITGYQLGKWVSTLRKDQDTLDPERWEELNTIGFIWDFDLEDNKKFRAARKKALKPWGPAEKSLFWEQSFAALERFIQREKHARVPDKHCEPDKNYEKGFRLGAWVKWRRINKNTMSPEQRARLTARGFVWHPKNPRLKTQGAITPKKLSNTYRAINLMLSNQAMTLEALATALGVQSTKLRERGLRNVHHMKELGAKFDVTRDGKGIVSITLSNPDEMRAVVKVPLPIRRSSKKQAIARQQFATKDTNTHVALRIMLSGEEIDFVGLAKRLNLRSTQFLKRGKIYVRNMKRLGADFKVRSEGGKIVRFKLQNVTEMKSLLSS